MLYVTWKTLQYNFSSHRFSANDIICPICVSFIPGCTMTLHLVIPRPYIRVCDGNTSEYAMDTHIWVCDGHTSGYAMGTHLGLGWLYHLRQVHYQDHYRQMPFSNSNEPLTGRFNWKGAFSNTSLVYAHGSRSKVIHLFSMDLIKYHLCPSDQELTMLL